MLPFLKPKKLASIIMTKTKSDGSTEPLHEEGEHSPELMKAAEDAIGGFHAKDAKAVVDAFTKMHKLFNNPHESEK